MIRQMEDKDKNFDRIMRTLKKFILNKIRFYHGESDSPKKGKLLKNLKRLSVKTSRNDLRKE
jgi:hypothetical protein